MTNRFVAAYTQPIENLARFKAQGCNLLVASELKRNEHGVPTVDQRVWRKAARDQGLPYIDTYLSDDDVNDQWLFGWMIRGSDEWNRRYKNRELISLSQIMGEAQYLSDLNAKAGTKKLIFANADGPHITGGLWEKPPYNGVNNGEKAILPLLTCRCSDWYVKMLTNPGEEKRRPPWLPAQAVWRMKTWCDQWQAPPSIYASFLETAQQSGHPLGPTGDDIRQEAAYLMGDQPTQVPDANGNPALFQQALISILILWTANGGSGGAFKWDVRTPDQTQASIDVTAKFLGTTPVEAPPVEPPPVNPDDPAALKAQLASVKAERDAALGKVATAKQALMNAAAQL